MTVPAVPAESTATLLADFSLEMTGKDIAALEAARDRIPPGTRINITFLGNENLDLRIAAAQAVKRFGFTPVPHISARRLASQQKLEEFLQALRDEGSSERVFVVGGDPTTPAGPYPDTLAVLRSGLLPDYGVREVSISGYPEGHPGIAEPVLWAALLDKAGELKAQGLAGGIITQFGFDVDPVVRWIEALRDRGVELPVRVGVPGPVGVRRLLGYATRFGVGTSAGIARKYGFSITNLMGTAGPDTFVRALARQYDAGRQGEVKLHFYPFGGLGATADWVTEFRKETPR